MDEKSPFGSQVCRCGQTGSQRHRTRRSPTDFVGLMDDADGRYFMSPTGGRPVSWSVPSILISEMELSGQGGGDEYILAAPTLD